MSSVRRLAVVNEFGALVGILTQHDLVQEALNEARVHRADLNEHDVVRALHAIGSPHNLSNLAHAS